MTAPAPSASHPGSRLRHLLGTRCLALPGAFNGLVARAVANAGFEGCYVSGAGVSAASGVPDIGLITLEGFCRVIRDVSASSGLPVLADADTGFGEGEMVARSVCEYAGAGGAGFHIEDQAFPKRCGHLDGKALVSIEHFQEKIEIAARTRDEQTGGAFVVCARTDGAAVEGLSGAIERARAYTDAGADMIFPEGLRTEGDFARFAEALRTHADVYLLANMTEFGRTEMISLARFADLGYHCVIFPVTTLRVAMGAVTEALSVLRREGSAQSLLDRMQTRAQLYEMLGYTPGEPWLFPNPSAHAPAPRALTH